jgi:hypothetical protein
VTPDIFLDHYSFREIFFLETLKNFRFACASIVAHSSAGMGRLKR